MKKSIVLLAAVFAVTGMLTPASAARAGGKASGSTVKAAAKKQAAKTGTRTGAKTGAKVKNEEWRIYVGRNACGKGCTWRESTGTSAWDYKSSCSCPWKAAVDACKRAGARLMTVKELLYTHKVECSSKKQADTCGKCYWSSDLKTTAYAWKVCFNRSDNPPRPSYHRIEGETPVRCIRNK